MNRESALMLHRLIGYWGTPEFIADFCDEHAIPFDAVCEAVRELATEAGEEPYCRPAHRAADSERPSTEKTTLEEVYRRALNAMYAVPVTPENTEIRSIAFHALLDGAEVLATDPGAKYDRAACETTAAHALSLETAQAVIAEEARTYRAALTNICNPIAAIQADAKARGERIDGAAAKALSRDPEHLRMMAADALRAGGLAFMGAHKTPADEPTFTAADVLQLVRRALEAR